MPLLNILLASDYISYFSSELTPPDSFLKLADNMNHGGDDVISHLSEFLSNLDVLKNRPKNINVNFILDYNFTGYYYFKLPPVNRRKINPIIEFELEDTLLDSVDEHYFEYKSQTAEKKSATEVGVYTVNKEFLNGLTDICRNFGLELKGVFPLNNLIDIKLGERARPQNHIYIVPEENFARIFVYKSGFLIDFSTVFFSDPLDADKTSKESLQARLDLINRKISIISIVNNYDYEVILEEKALCIVKINDNQRLELSDSPDAAEARRAFSPASPENLITPSVINKARRTNLLKSNLLIVKELKKHAKPLIMSAAIITACLIIYTGLTVYNGVKNYQQYQGLNQKYIGLVNKYLKKGTSKTNALYIIKNKVKKLKAQSEKNRKFSDREYKILTLLKEFSLFKEKAPSFLLDNFYLADNIIRVQGQVDSEVDFERLKECFQELFPKNSHNLSYNQESEGDKTFRFKISVRKTASSPG